MEIKLQFFGRVFSICIGHKTEWFEQLAFISIIEEFYDENMNVVFASSKLQLFMEK